MSDILKFVTLKILILTSYAYGSPKVTTVAHTKGYTIKNVSPSQVHTLLGAGDINLSQDVKEVLAADFSYSRMLGPDLVSQTRGKDTNNRDLGRSLFSYRYKDPSKSNEIVVINDIDKDGLLNRFTFPLSPRGEPVTEMTKLDVTANADTGALLVKIESKTRKYELNLLEINGKYFRQVTKKIRLSVDSQKETVTHRIEDRLVRIRTFGLQGYDFKRFLTKGEQIVDVKAGADSHIVYTVDSTGQVFSNTVKEIPDTFSNDVTMIRRERVSDAMATKLGILISHSQFQPKKPLRREAISVGTNSTDYGVSLGNEATPSTSPPK